MYSSYSSLSTCFNVLNQLFSVRYLGSSFLSILILILCFPYFYTLESTIYLLCLLHLVALCYFLLLVLLCVASIRFTYIVCVSSFLLLYNSYATVSIALRWQQLCPGLLVLWDSMILWT